LTIYYLIPVYKSTFKYEKNYDLIQNKKYNNNK